MSFRARSCEVSVFIRKTETSNALALGLTPVREELQKMRTTQVLGCAAMWAPRKHITLMKGLPSFGFQLFNS